MNRSLHSKPALHTLIALLLALAVIAASAQQPDFGKVAVRTETLAPNLHVLFGAGGNVAVLTGDDGAVVIDDQFSEMAPKLRAAIARLTEKPVKFVINTHWHPDHSGGNAAFGRSGSIIIAHENTRRRLSAPQLVDFFNMKTTAEPAAALPVVTFTDSVDLHLDGEDIAVVHVANAHTDSDAVLYFRNADAIHAGDVFTQQGGYPFIDLGSGGSIDGLIAATRAILVRIGEHTRVIPGHGPLATRADVARRLEMLVAVRNRVAAQLQRGRSLAQVIASQPCREFDAQYQGGAISADVWVQRVYVDLARSRRAAKSARP